MPLKLSRKEALKANCLSDRKAKRPSGERKAAQECKQRLFLASCHAHGLPEPIPEARWSLERKWLFDYCWAPEKVAVEIVGGVWIGGHHSRGQSQIDDMHRRNTAQLIGYIVLEFTPDQVYRTGEAFPIIKRALEARK
jgi:hypothetical protein